MFKKCFSFLMEMILFLDILLFNSSFWSCHCELYFIVKIFFLFLLCRWYSFIFCLWHIYFSFKIGMKDFYVFNAHFYSGLLFVYLNCNGNIGVAFSALFTFSKVLAVFCSSHFFVCFKIRNICNIELQS